MGQRKHLCAVLVLAALAPPLAACGQSRPAEGLISNVDRARTAATLTSLQQGLVTAQTVSAESPGGSAPALVTALQQRDPSNRYTTAPPTDAGIVQVMGGGGGPVMLVGISAPPASPRAPYYVAAWAGGGSTLYYLGRQPPAYSATPPAADGWSPSPPLA